MYAGIKHDDIWSSTDNTYNLKLYPVEKVTQTKIPHNALPWITVILCPFILRSKVITFPLCLIIIITIVNQAPNLQQFIQITTSQLASRFLSLSPDSLDVIAIIKPYLISPYHSQHPPEVWGCFFKRESCRA